MRDNDWLLAHLDAAVSIMSMNPNTTRQELHNRLRLSGVEMDEIIARLERMGVINNGVGRR
jgi:hypothetical protein